MNYHVFASLYDSLMEEAPYDQWVYFIKQSLMTEDLSGISVLDVGCGTGELLLRLLDEGVHGTGVDLSAEMLVVAKEKFNESGYPLLLEQNMCTMPKLGWFDVVTVFCDSINYLSEEQDVQQAFKRVADQLKEGGLLLFDFHSISKIEDGFIGQTFADDGEDIAYIWTSFSGEYDYSVEHELSFFIKDEHGRYERYNELHKQRTFSVRTYQQWLEEAGFIVETITADFSNQSPDDESERIFIKARKK
jgi:SAM-dependent methyltransferase